MSSTLSINYLVAISQFTLLQQLYGTVVIPKAVYRELIESGLSTPEAIEAPAFGWVQTYQAADRPLVEELRDKSHEGEAEAIALALELKAEQLLLDRLQGRTIAHRFNLRCVGILAILIEAKRKRLLPIVKPSLDALVTQAGFWVPETLYHRVLEIASE